MPDEADRPFVNHYAKDWARRPRYGGRLEDWNAQARASRAEATAAARVAATTPPPEVTGTPAAVAEPYLVPDWCNPDKIDD